MKPPSKGEEEEMIVKKISSDALTINDHTFTFDSIADPDSTQVTIWLSYLLLSHGLDRLTTYLFLYSLQDEIFQLVGAPLVENCLAGFNSSVFAYGQVVIMFICFSLGLNCNFLTR